MNKTPHFVLFSRTREQASEHDLQGGSWYFRLESDSSDTFEASDVEVDVSRERLELLAVVRGLEALDQPSSVTLVTSSKQISRAVRQGLEYWRIRDWKWERFGEKVPMKNADLWQRIDCAMRIHDVRCRTYRLDGPHAHHAPSKSVAVKARAEAEAVSSDLDAGMFGDRNTSNVKRKQRKASFAFRPMVAATRWTASSLSRIADGLQRLVPEGPASPHATT